MIKHLSSKFLRSLLLINIANVSISLSIFSMESANTENITDLHAVAGAGQVDKVITLLEEGIDINTPNDNGDTPLHIAAKRGQADAVKTLLNRGADINAKNNNNETPLISVIKADIYTRGNVEDKPWLKILKDNRVTIIKTLLNKGADINIKNKKGRTPYLLAVENKQNDAAKAILESLRQKK